MALAAKDISSLVAMDAASLGALIMQKGTQGAAEEFSALLSSYRIAATVANAAWNLVASVREDQPAWQREEAFAALEKALHLYSPANFPLKENSQELAYGTQLLEETYNHLAQWAPNNMAEAMLEALYERIKEHRGRLLGIE